MRLTQRKGRNVQVLIDGKWVSTGCKTKEDALIKLVSCNPDTITFGEFAKDYYNRRDTLSKAYQDELFCKKSKDSTYREKQCVLDNYIIPRFGNEKLINITANEIKVFYLTIQPESKSAKGKSVAWRNRILYVIKDIFNMAVQMDILKTSPASSLERIIYKAERKKLLTEDELNILFPEDDEQLIKVWGSLYWATYFCLLKDSGFRPGEVAALEKDSFVNGDIVTFKSVDSKGVEIQNRFKNRDGEEAKISVTITDQTMRLVNRQIESLKDGNVYLFIKETGKVLTNNSSNDKFVRVCKRYGITGVTQYCMRHLFATMLYNEVDTDTYKELMGDSQIYDTYLHRSSEKRITQIKKKLIEAGLK